MEGKKILVTGVTGQVGFPFALHHSNNNDVWAIARFGDAEKRKQLESSGVTCQTVDLVSGEFGDLPQDFDCVFHFAVARLEENDFDKEIKENAEATGKLMSYCRNAKAFFHCSTTGVYEDDGHTVFTEKSPLGDNHRVMMPTYSIGKIAVEAVVRFCASEFQLPTVICRLNVPYGVPGAGWPSFHLMMMQHGVDIPVHTDSPSEYTLIHQDDINRLAPEMLQAAATTAPIYNFCGQEHVSIQEWCAYLSELTGLEAKLVPTPDTLGCVKTDNSKLRALAGPAKVHWKDGLRRLVEDAGAMKA